jgi:uncharacterized protein
MKIGRWGAEVFVIACAGCAGQAQTPVQAAKKHLLVIGEEKGYRHKSIFHAMATIERLGEKTGLWDTTIRTDTEALTKKALEFNARNLNNLDAVLFFTGGELEMDAAQKADLRSFVQDDGKGFIGVHGATIAFTDWPEYGEMIGGYFDDHHCKGCTQRRSNGLWPWRMQMLLHAPCLAK